MIIRKEIDEMQFILNNFKILIILGVRQCGKTTIAKQLTNYLKKDSIYLDLELLSDQEKLNNPELFLELNEDKTVIIDEIQRMPSLFPLIRALTDKHPVNARFILLGSSSLDLVQQSSESLAGRAIYRNLTPFLLNEINDLNEQSKHWLVGGFPEIFLTKSAKKREYWFESYINTYIERDLRMLGLVTNTYNLFILFKMLAKNQGQILSYADYSKALGITAPTVKKHIHFFEKSFTLFLLQPWHFNINKRLIKSPRTYISDTGMLHYILQIANMNELLSNPIAGYSWETYCILQIVGNTKLTPYFYRTADGSEADLILVNNENKVEYAFEFKINLKAKISKGTYIAFDDLNAKNRFVVTPTTKSKYPLTKNIFAAGILEVVQILNSEAKAT